MTCSNLKQIKQLVWQKVIGNLSNTEMVKEVILEVKIHWRRKNKKTSVGDLTRRAEVEYEPCMMTGYGDSELNRQTDRQTDGRTDGRTDGQTDGLRHSKISHSVRWEDKK
jgi:hypothetical protein